MKAKDIMNCFFVECLISDSADTIKNKMLEAQSDFALVVDKHGKYMGIIYANAVFRWHNMSHSCADLFEAMPSILEDADLKAVHDNYKSVIPVVNKDQYPVGIIQMKEIFDLWQSEQKENNYQKKGPSSRSAKYTIDDIVGHTHAIMSLKERIISAAKVKSTVLIMGETGVGKELVAQAIANLSARRFKSFVRINCAAIPESLLESELFGYEAGAYTGALKGGNLGKFEIADGGTILLDEIGDMQLVMQAKILRVLQEREIEKIGGRYPIPVDVRIIAATHADLDRMMNENTFRHDLYYRLNVIPIHIPPLRDHIEDIEALFLYFMEKCSIEMEIEIPTVESGVFEMLSHYHWPGNIRELKNLVEMLAASSNGRITKGMLSSYFTDKMDLHDSNENYLKLNAFEAEREMILKYLKVHDNNKNKVADVLGISRSTLYNKLKRYQIK
ncbi:sigma-54 interaction domain-containing protein [Fusibacter ferrireducens]|uniref:Sigma 54-interacting transcriptional regulator n=1 Tax=Fusibacter ferrireducens TaxID=2785058 RepID=A0ABR9ZYY8_9FIRM|nr:sigma 54-interacting transcriptional regulator [Fusibacter ferrireducens]MBF4695586.1 sigma 54-interacting transcriptional regulator [Fusibacter ferrireducens]